MDERQFVTKKRESWDQLTALVEKANSKQGIRALSREEVLSLGPLYRRTSSDLAYARAHAVSDDLIQHLNGLVGRAHALLYEAETSSSPAQSVLQFYLYDFPALLQRHFRFFLAAFSIAVIGGVFAYWLVISQPAKVSLFIPEGLRDSMEAWKSGKVSDEAHVEFAGMLMTHNLQIGLIAFASGVFGGVPSFFEIFETGGMIGAMGAVMTQVHRHSTFWPGILPHGIAEITAILICGAAGFMIGLSFLFPGGYRRETAFRLAGMDAIKLVLGTIPLFIFAGMIEGMFSHLALPASIRYTFAAVNGVMWYLYLFLPRSRPETLSSAVVERNSAQQ
jgi:uncharacterized membrane protein SpoIIM required for sporulation